MTRSNGIPASHEGEVELVVLIKAAPEIGQKHGETVCVAGVDAYGAWHRLYPVPFRDLTAEQKFTRWDRIRAKWRKPNDDDRIESKRIDPNSLRVISSVTGDERAEVAARSIAASLDCEFSEGRSLALIRPENPEFIVRRLTEREFSKSARRRAQLVDQSDFFSQSVIEREPPPYAFHFRFDHCGSRRNHTCIDWETEQTFFKWRRMYGEDSAISRMKEKWGNELPKRGLAFAMGTHRVKMFRKWLLSGIIQAPEPAQRMLLL